MIMQTLTEFLDAWWKQIEPSIPREKKIELLKDAAVYLWAGLQDNVKSTDIINQTDTWIKDVNPM